MARKQPFLDAEFSTQWKETYPRFQLAEQKGIDKVVMALLKGVVTPGMRIKPIEPENYFSEARASDGDRVAFRISEGRVRFVDIIAHDDIGLYGKQR